MFVLFRLDGLFKPEKMRKQVGDKVDEAKIKEDKEIKKHKDENNLEEKDEKDEKEDEKDKKENLRFLVLDDFERLFEMGAVLNVR